MQPPDSNAHTPPQLSTSPDPTPKKEEDKLDLEIVNLKKRNTWYVVWQPMLAILLGIAGLCFTVLQVQCQRKHEQQKEQTDRELERTARFQNQIRLNSDELIRSAKDDRQTASRLLFLLEDVKTGLDAEVKEGVRLSAILPTYERSLTESLVILVRDDYDFTRNPRDVSFANVIVEHWKDYTAYLKTEPRKLDYIVYKYTRTMQDFRDQNSAYVRCLMLDEKTHQVTVCRDFEKQKNEPQLYNYLSDIVAGFLKHIEILGTDNLSDDEKNRKQKMLLYFQNALCNRPVSENLLGTFLEGGNCEP